MMSFSGLPEGLNQRSPWIHVKQNRATEHSDNFKKGSLVYSMETSLVQPNVSFNKLAFSSRGINLAL